MMKTKVSLVAWGLAANFSMICPVFAENSCLTLDVGSPKFNSWSKTLGKCRAVIKGELKAKRIILFKENQVRFVTGYKACICVRPGQVEKVARQLKTIEGFDDRGL